MSGVKKLKTSELRVIEEREMQNLFLYIVNNIHAIQTGQDEVSLDFKLNNKQMERLCAWGTLMEDVEMDDEPEEDTPDEDSHDREADKWFGKNQDARPER